METNDQTNLRLDHMKNVVHRQQRWSGASKRRSATGAGQGPNRVVGLAQGRRLQQAPDLPQGAFVENNLLMADFDSLAA